MQTQTTNVVPPQQVQSAAVEGSMPKVLTETLLANLRATNRVIRWLRENGHMPLAVHPFSERPSVIVDRMAAGFLCRAGQGFNSVAQPDGSRIGTVIIDGCAIRWHEEMDA